MEDNLFLRKANNSDMELLFKWANDKSVRANSFNTAQIDYDEHIKWFKMMMADSSIIQMILIAGDMPIGQIRLKCLNDEAEISYSIASEFRQQGYGHRILELVHEIVKTDYPGIHRLAAKVKPENVSSNKLFIDEGYKTEYYCYTMDIIR